MRIPNLAPWNRHHVVLRQAIERANSTGGAINKTFDSGLKTKRSDPGSSAALTHPTSSLRLRQDDL